MADASTILITVSIIIGFAGIATVTHSIYKNPTLSSDSNKNNKVKYVAVSILMLVFSIAIFLIYVTEITKFGFFGIDDVFRLDAILPSLAGVVGVFIQSIRKMDRADESC